MYTFNITMKKVAQLNQDHCAVTDNWLVFFVRIFKTFEKLYHSLFHDLPDHVFEHNS